MLFTVPSVANFTVLPLQKSPTENHTRLWFYYSIKKFGKQEHSCLLYFWKTRVQNTRRNSRRLEFMPFNYSASGNSKVVLLNLHAVYTHFSSNTAAAHRAGAGKGIEPFYQALSYSTPHFKYWRWEIFGHFCLVVEEINSAPTVYLCFFIGQILRMREKWSFWLANCPARSCIVWATVGAWVE